MPRPVRWTGAIPRALLVLAAGLLAACADTNAPAPAPEEVLLVVNTRGNSLSIVPIDPPGADQARGARRRGFPPQRRGGPG